MNFRLRILIESSTNFNHCWHWLNVIILEIEKYLINSTLPLSLLLSSWKLMKAHQADWLEQSKFLEGSFYFIYWASDISQIAQSVCNTIKVVYNRVKYTRRRQIDLQLTTEFLAHSFSVVGDSTRTNYLQHLFISSMGGVIFLYKYFSILAETSVYKLPFQLFSFIKTTHNYKSICLRDSSYWKLLSMRFDNEYNILYYYAREIISDVTLVDWLNSLLNFEWQDK